MSSCISSQGHKVRSEMVQASKCFMKSLFRLVVKVEASRPKVVGLYHEVEEGTAAQCVVLSLQSLL